MFSPPIVIIYDYFDKYKSFASGISMCGHSFAVIALFPVLRLLIDELGWRGSLFIFAGFVLNGCVLSFAFRPNTTLQKQELVESNKQSSKQSSESKQSNKQSTMDMFDLSVLKDLNFLLFALGYASNLFQMTIAYQMYVSKAIAEGLGKLEGTLLASVIGISAICSRIMFSVIANLPCSNHILIFSVSTIVFATANCLSFIPWNFPSHAVVCCVIGIMVGE